MGEKPVDLEITDLLRWIAEGNGIDTLECGPILRAASHGIARATRAFKDRHGEDTAFFWLLSMWVVLCGEIACGPPDMRGAVADAIGSPLTKQLVDLFLARLDALEGSPRKGPLH